MQTSVTFKNIDPSDQLKDYVTSKLDRMDKLLDNPAEAQVVLSVEKIRHYTEIRLKGDRLNIVCREKASDMYSSIDLALDKLEKQLKKQKEKIKNHRPNKGADSVREMNPDMNPTAERLNIVCREKASDMYSSIDLALDKLEKQLKKQKEKIKNHRPNKGADSVREMNPDMNPTAEAAPDMPEIRIESIDYKPMDIEEAGMQLELTEDNFLVFTNSRTNQVNVIYRRKNGGLGLIEPL